MKPYSRNEMLGGMYIRDAVAIFAAEMERKLQKNDHKTGWRDQPVEAHIGLLKLELAEFEIAREFFTVEEQKKELVDIANFCMIIHDKLSNPGEPYTQADNALWDAHQIDSVVERIRKILSEPAVVHPSPQGPTRHCTCPPDERPSMCQHKYALTECRNAEIPF